MNQIEDKLESEGPDAEIMKLFIAYLGVTISSDFSSDLIKSKDSSIEKMIDKSELPRSIKSLYAQLRILVWRSQRHSAFSAITYHYNILEIVEAIRRCAEKITREGHEDEKQMLSKFINFYRVYGVNYILASAPNHPLRHETSNFDI